MSRSWIIGFLAFLLAGACGTNKEPPQSGMAGTGGAVRTGAAGAAGTTGAVGATGAAGVGATAVAGSGAAGMNAAAGSLTINWSFPALISDKARGLVFPTYMTHLLGKTLRHPFPNELVCVDVSGATTETAATLVVKFAIYAQEATQDFKIPAGGDTRVCLTPIFDLTKLYALNDATPGRIEASIASGGKTLSAAMQAVAISPVNDIAWLNGIVPKFEMQDLSAVFVTPKDPKIDQLQRVAAEASVFGGFGGGDPYQRDPYVRSFTLPPKAIGTEELVTEAGEAISWSMPTVSGGAGAVVDVYLFTHAQFDAWEAGKSQAATRVWLAQGAGAKGAVTGLPSNAYYLVFFNVTGTTTHTITWSRNPTREDVAVDVLGSIYQALQAYKTKYSNITDSYFMSFQHIRRVSEVLTALSANCLDGSLVFASVLELLGMEPVLVLTTGHAYVGVKSAPGSKVIWTVETTMIGTSSFLEAYNKGLNQYLTDRETDPQFHLVDVRSMRTKGVLPLPQ